MALRKLLHLLYVGTALARMHASSYLAATINAVLWFTLIFVPSILLTGNPEQAFLTFLPGVFALTIASTGMWSATEFLRWYVYQGLTDLFRECGLNVFHYLLCGIHTDVALQGFATYLLAAFVACYYANLDPLLVIPANPVLMVLAIAVAIPTYLLCGALMAYLYTATRIGGVWTNIIQMIVIVGTIVPPKALPIPWIALLNPATIVAELLRASYGTNTFSVEHLLALTPILATLYVVLAYVIAQASDRRIARYGIEFRI